MIKQQNNVLWHKTNAMMRFALVKGAANPFAKNVLVNEFPKSGASWSAQMLSDTLDLPFPRNRLPMLRSSILHGHYITKTNIAKTLIVWRDGRDVAVSWFYHLVVGHEQTNDRARQLVRREAGITDPKNLEESFPLALEYFLKQPRYPGYSWVDFVNRWADNDDVVHVKYEDLKVDASRELKRITYELTGTDLPDIRSNKIVEKYSFQKQSGRLPGNANTNKYLRKGIVGDWKNHFNEKSRSVFADLAGDQLIKLGYETNKNWVKE